MTARSASQGRRLDLDWLRITAFGLLILYHLGLLYVPWPYHAKSLHSVFGLVPALEALNPWRLLLLFMISGVATRFMARRLNPARLLADRSVRLLPPLVFGMLVVVPPQSYVQAVEQYGYADGFLPFYLYHYLPGRPPLCNALGCLALPTWNHLWFVLYLWTYTVVLAVLLLLLRLSRAQGVALPTAAALMLPFLVLLAARVLLFASFPPNDALLGDWYDHAVYGGAFLFGYAMADHEQFWRATERLRWPALAVAVLLLPSVWAAGGVGLWALLKGLSLPPTLAIPFYQWATLIAAFGFSIRWLPHTDVPVRWTLTEAVFPFYIVHQTALVVCVHSLRAWALPMALEAAIILSITAAACWATYSIARRVTWLRPLFGLRLHATPEITHAR